MSEYLQSHVDEVRRREADPLRDPNSHLDVPDVSPEQSLLEFQERMKTLAGDLPDIGPDGELAFGEAPTQMELTPTEYAKPGDLTKEGEIRRADELQSKRLQEYRLESARYLQRLPFTVTEGLWTGVDNALRMVGGPDTQEAAAELFPAGAEFVTEMQGFLGRGGSADQTTREIAQWGVGFMGIMRGLSMLSARLPKAAQLGTLSSALIADIGAAATTLDPHIERLSTVFQEFGAENDFIDFLASQDGPEADNRIRNAIEAAGLGLAAEGVFLAARGAKEALWVLRDLEFAASGDGARVLQQQRGSVGAPRERAPVDELGFYLKSEEALLNLPQESGTGQQMRAMLEKAGVKPAEMTELGLDELLAQDKVTRDELMRAIDANRSGVRVEEIVLGEGEPGPEGTELFDDDETRAWIADAIFGGDFAEVTSRVTDESMERVAANLDALGRDGDALRSAWKKIKDDPGASISEHEEDMLLTLANTASDAMQTARTKYETETLPGGENYRERLFTLPNRERGFTMGDNQHFSINNVAFHLRTKDRTINIGGQNRKVLFIEELQSDWAQGGRKRGFMSDKTEANVAETNQSAAAFREFTNLFRPAVRRAITDAGRTDPVDWMIGVGRNINDDQVVHAAGQMMSGGPLAAAENAPEGTAKLLRMLLDEAPENAIPSGSRPGLEAVAEDPARIFMMSRQTYSTPDAPFVMKSDQWNELAAKRVLQIAEEGGYDAVAWAPGQTHVDRWKEEGLRTQYDRIMPKAFKRVFGERPQGTVEVEGYDAPYIILNDQMRQRARQGLSLFTPAGATAGALTAAEYQRRQREQRDANRSN